LKSIGYASQRTVFHTVIHNYCEKIFFKKAGLAVFISTGNLLYDLKRLKMRIIAFVRDILAGIKKK